ncbi:MAG TPA: tetratricopeptide repeat protein [Methylomirabilota bacterium]|jgi:predicted Zn-dependent protease|nr:tetratricopeptide repeat protein [Methylomirabilota bacterium]
MGRRVLAGVIILSLLASACASRNVPPIGAGGRPFKPEPDERSLWAKAEKEEEALLKRAKPYDDPLLEEYLGKIGDRLLSDEVRAAGGPGFKFGVIRDPTLNAFAMPNGRVYVHTGLLSRLENEAQLATVLGHEMTHVTDRHALRFTRDAQTKQILYTVGAIAASIGVAVAAGSQARAGDHVGAAVLSQTANAVLGLGLALATIAAINGYGRDLEREADHGGMNALVRAGYDLKEAPKVFKLLQSESKDRGPVETFFFGSHPRLQERIDTTGRLLETTYAPAAAEPDRIKNTEDFDLRMRTVVRENAYEDIRLGRFALAQRQLDRVLAITPRDPVAQLYYGDLHRLQAQRTRSLADKAAEAQKALERYERSAELDPSLPDPHRQLGFLYYQQKDKERAKAAFEKYLALKPEAPDAKRIKEYLLELDR